MTITKPGIYDLGEKAYHADPVDDWSANNVGGNIGWRIPRTDKMVASIRALHDAGARL